MLTFRFTDVRGEMTEEELLTAGMEGKQMRLEFSEEWEGLRRAVVFVAGGRTCTIVDAGEVVTIPAQILSESLTRLYVGAYGLTEEGMVVIPAMYATGPFIHIGASGSGGGTDYTPEDPFWLGMEQEMRQALRFTPQTLQEEEKEQARQNIQAAREDPQAKQLLVTLLENSTYTTNQNDNLVRLNAALLGSRVCTITSVLELTNSDNPSTLALYGSGYRATLTPRDGHIIRQVTVLMDGQDITATAYDSGVVDIPDVAGDIQITAISVDARIHVERIAKGMVSYTSSNNELQVTGIPSTYATMLPTGQYLLKGKKYRIGLGACSSDYLFNLYILEATDGNQTFPYIEDTTISYSNIRGRQTYTNWLKQDYNLTARIDNLILCVNMRRLDNAAMTEEDYALLQENLVVEMTDP